jgi:hypothetical protein
MPDWTIFSGARDRNLVSWVRRKVYRWSTTEQEYHHEKERQYQECLGWLRGFPPHRFNNPVRAYPSRRDAPDQPILH